MTLVRKAAQANFTKRGAGNYFQFKIYSFSYLERITVNKNNFGLFS
jgi:hypothetical protein